MNPWLAWNVDPPLVAVLLTLLLAYLVGFRKARSRVRQRTHVRPQVAAWHAFAFGGALAVLYLAVASPLDTLAGGLLTAHMVQHLLLWLVVPLLLVVSRPGYVLAWALPLVDRRSLARRWNRSRLSSVWRPIDTLIHSPVGALVISTAVVWLWHAPFLYEAALRNQVVHWLEHATFLAAFTVFWTVVAAPLGRRRADGGTAALLLFGQSVQGSALGALLVFSPVAWYPTYLTRVGWWDLTPLADQQLAGTLMWMPLGTVYVLMACAAVWRWVNGAATSDRRSVTVTTPTGGD